MNTVTDPLIPHQKVHHVVARVLGHKRLDVSLFLLSRPQDPAFDLDLEALAPPGSTREERVERAREVGIGNTNQLSVRLRPPHILESLT